MNLFPVDINEFNFDKKINQSNNKEKLILSNVKKDEKSIIHTKLTEDIKEFDEIVNNIPESVEKELSQRENINKEENGINQKEIKKEEIIENNEEIIKPEEKEEKIKEEKKVQIQIKEEVKEENYISNEQETKKENEKNKDEKKVY